MFWSCSFYSLLGQTTSASSDSSYLCFFLSQGFSSVVWFFIWGPLYDLEGQRTCNSSSYSDSSRGYLELSIFLAGDGRNGSRLACWLSLYWSKSIWRERVSCGGGLGLRSIEFLTSGVTYLILPEATPNRGFEPLDDREICLDAD